MYKWTNQTKIQTIGSKGKIFLKSFNHLEDDLLKLILFIQYHPDKLNVSNSEPNEDKDRKFKQIETAYRILIDADSRRKYDAEFSFMITNLPIINEQIRIDDLVLVDGKV